MTGYQPYRRGARTRKPGLTLAAMLRGRPAVGQHPMDLARALQRHARRRRM